MFNKENNNKVVYPRCKTVWRYYIGQIRKAKIYGHWFRGKDFYILEDRSIINLGKTKHQKVWCKTLPNHYDKDKNFLCEIAINFRKEKLRKAILEHEEWIKTVPERIKHREERIDAIKKAINLVSVEQFDWKDYRIKEQLNGNIKVKSIDIENVVDKKTFMSL
tara:strand:- start:55 stop:543 length:489 start_codon:yes stop_codon:yes gene_type:complete